MNENQERIIVAAMNPRRMNEWTPMEKRKRIKLSRKTWLIAAAAVCCLSAGTFLLMQEATPSESVMSHLTTGFEYDETIGRLQYVSSVLPQSAMVFLSSSDDALQFTKPTETQVMHVWSQEEPWIEYACSGEVYACQGGEVMTVVKNRSDEYTVRVMHDGGYESVYSGLTDVFLQENDAVSAGEMIGNASGYAAFELRKDGLSVLPVFNAM